MSGVFCPTCMEGDLCRREGGEGKDPVECDLCGWRGDRSGLGSTWPMAPEGPSLRELKKAGKLFYVWVEFDGDPGDATFDVMEALGATGASGGGRIVHLTMETRPTEDQISEVRAVAGVREVRVV
jgi:hypothetical protein